LIKSTSQHATSRYFRAAAFFAEAFFAGAFFAGASWPTEISGSPKANTRNAAERGSDSLRKIDNMEAPFLEVEPECRTENVAPI
jgi:hypothetical protein